jgi:hypothetical protein
MVEKATGNPVESNGTRRGIFPASGTVKFQACANLVTQFRRNVYLTPIARAISKRAVLSRICFSLATQFSR